MRHTAWLALGTLVTLAGCSEDGSTPLDLASDPLAGPRAGLVPDDYVETGRRLFFEETFGGNGRTCGTCHPAPTLVLTPQDIAALPKNDPFFNGKLDIDREAVQAGLIAYPLGGTLLEPEIVVFRAIPSVVNLLRTSPFTIDGRAATLQEQALEAVLLHALDGAADRRGERLPTPDELDAIAAFQQSLVTPGHDRGVRTNSALAEEGEELFVTLPENGGAGCAVCHVPPFFTDNDFHNNRGCVNGRGRCDPVDPGRCRLDVDANDCDVGPAFTSFNTPQLRDVRSTAPYFHDNAFPDLEAVVRFYNSRGFTLSPAAVRLGVFPSGGLGLDDHQIDAIVAFMERM